MSQSIRIVKVVPDTDMRAVHRYRERLPRLKPAQGVLYVNKAHTLCRIIDSARAVHNYYAPNGEVFDMGEIQRQVAALRLVLEVRAQDNVLAEPKKKAPRKLKAVA